jgi:acyl-CoA reductase-like NAD-dependent aldehyde dehydrogenase
MEAWPNMYQEKIIDITTGEETIRPYTPEEVAEVEAAIEATRLEQEAKAAAQSEKETARQAILERLGITEDEAKLLLG